jgi:hypothetical protein
MQPMLPTLFVADSVEALEDLVAKKIGPASQTRIIHIPIRIAEDKKDISVAQIRSELDITSFSRKENLIISILPLNRASEEAQNALLKPLEELSDRVSFILGTTQLYQVVPTIRSRCVISENGKLQASSHRFSGFIDRILSGGYAFLADPVLGKLSADSSADLLLEVAQHLVASYPDCPKTPSEAKKALELRNLVLQNNLQPKLGVEAYLLNLAHSMKTPLE